MDFKTATKLGRTVEAAVRVVVCFVTILHVSMIYIRIPNETFETQILHFFSAQRAATIVECKDFYGNCNDLEAYCADVPQVAEGCKKTCGGTCTKGKFISKIHVIFVKVKLFDSLQRIIQTHFLSF